MTDRPTVQLAPERHRRVIAGHPWAYSNEIRMSAAAKALPPGAVVRLETAHGEPVGVALFNPHSLIAARILTRDTAAVIDQAFLAGRLAHALALRDRLFATPFYRLVHAEADGLPGLIIDRYGAMLSVEINSAGMALLEAPVLAAARDVLGPDAIVIRRDSAARTLEGLGPQPIAVEGALTGPVALTENGARFAIDPIGGQKTGWFYDQRDNRRAVAALASGAELLDLFAYAGGFGIQAAVAGAARVTLVDSSAVALAAAARNAALSGVAERVALETGDGFERLEHWRDQARTFDIVVADPPAFARSRKDVPIALKAYAKLARLAARLVRPGGFLFIASCSHNIEPEPFAEAVRAGLARAERTGRILRQAGAAADHPVHPFLPETAYLKSQLLQLD